MCDAIRSVGLWLAQVTDVQIYAVLTGLAGMALGAAAWREEMRREEMYNERD